MDQENDATVARTHNIEQAAKQIRQAWEIGTPVAPVRALIGEDDIDAAYAVQDLNTARWLADGRRLVGRKIGATSTAIQELMGVDFPDYGMLFADMQLDNAATVPFSRLHQPFVEGEMAVVLKYDLKNCDVSLDEVADAVDYMVPAIEIIGSRILGWDLRMTDTIADNASSSHFIIGKTPVSLKDMDPFAARMTIQKNAEIASEGDAKVCLGSPLFALVWLAAEAARRGKPLQAGEVVLTGAMGPIVPVAAGDEINLEIEGLGDLAVHFSGD